jgi:hypothetical protein
MDQLLFLIKALFCTTFHLLQAFKLVPKIPLMPDHVYLKDSLINQIVVSF